MFFKKKLKILTNDSFSKGDATKFYTLKYYYDPTSPNIAVIADKNEFKRQIEFYKKQINTKNNDKLIQVDDKKAIFIRNNMETAIVLLEDYCDLYIRQIRYRKFL